MELFSKAGNIFRQPRALQAANAMLQGNLSLIPSKLFVGGLSPTTDVDILKDVFGRFGKIVYVVVISDRETGVSNGFGFVTYDSIDAANKAMQRINDQELDGRIIGVNPADSGGGGGGLARREVVVVAVLGSVVVDLNQNFVISSVKLEQTDQVVKVGKNIY